MLINLNPVCITANPYLGQSSIRGNVTKEEIQCLAFVQLYESVSKALIAQTKTNENGFYSFDNLNPAFSYFVVAHDHTTKYNAVIQDNVVPK